MGFWKNLIGIEDDDDEEEELEEYEEEEKTPRFSFNFGAKKEEKEEPKEEPKPAPTFLKKPETRTAPTTAPAAAAAPAAPARAAASRTSAPAASATSRKFTDQFKMVVIEPQSFEESPKLVDNLRAKKPVIINLENLETDVARKIFDFLSGATYALNGNVQKIANNIFVFTPDNVDVAYSKGSPKMPAAEDAVKSPWK